MKCGSDVEGRYKGLKTIFLASSELAKLGFILRTRKIQAIYISDLCKEKMTVGEQELLCGHTSDYFVTLETDDLNVYLPSLLQAVHVMYRIASTDFFGLKETDQIKFDDGSRVYCCPKEVMYKTDPNDYQGDLDI